MFILDNIGNTIITAHNVLSTTAIEAYLRGASTVERFVGKGVRGSAKPRREICYSVDGFPYCYSGIEQPTRLYPQHILDNLPVFMKIVSKHIPDNPYCKLSYGIDVIYDAAFERGGSIGAHSDNEYNWGLVMIFTLGQTRWLRVKRRSDKKFYNVQMPHNSLIVMHGGEFQERYTHQVDKLCSSETDLSTARLQSEVYLMVHNAVEKVNDATDISTSVIFPWGVGGGGGILYGLKPRFGWGRRTDCGLVATATLHQQ